MAIFASRRELKKARAQEDAPFEPTSSVPAAQHQAAEHQAAEHQATDRLVGQAVEAAPSVIVDTADAVPSEVTAQPIAPPTTSEAVDIEQVDIEPVDIEGPPAEGAPLAFGIADAIRLMRSLPADPNIDLVVRVVRVTLGAVNVSVEEIMADATKKEESIKEGIAVLQVEVAALEKELYARRCEIAAREADLKETATVRERLHMADKYTGPRPPPPPADATRIAHPKPSEWAAEWERAEQAKRG